MEDSKNIIKFESLINPKEKINFNDSKFNKLIFLYSAAIKELDTRINIIKEEFKYLYDYDLIDHVKNRIKTPDSIANKMKSKEYELTYENLIKNINDIAGIRIVCGLKNDIFVIRKLIRNIPGIKILKEKDYINNPKKSGYSSYHLIVGVPVNLLEKLLYVKVEIQIRTLIMDCWANAEHKIKYKPEKEPEASISKELIACAKIANKLDNKIRVLSN